MHRLSVRKKIDAPADRMWEAVTKKGIFGQYGSQVLSEEIADEIAEWVEGGGVRIGFGGWSVPLLRANTSLSVRHAGAGVSEVTVTMDYRVGWGPLGTLIHAALLRPAMRRILGDLIEGAAYPAAHCALKVQEREGTLMEAKLVLAA